MTARIGRIAASFSPGAILLILLLLKLQDATARIIEPSLLLIGIEGRRPAIKMPDQAKMSCTTRPLRSVRRKGLHGATTQSEREPESDQVDGLALRGHTLAARAFPPERFMGKL